ncbi:MAG: blue light sensor protein [Rhodobacteraceae bacterium]|jgi:hypothetical protein|nr:MAG: blue light sensor protein [Paracoccaceae bacterium]|tara:strand:- start:432 stop:857 length:426 start_codon:yes stop_codon:yes gene_type:complete
MRRKDKEELKHIIYASRPFGFDDAVLKSILLSSRNNNTKSNVTGALICRSDLYLQLLEGPEDAVDQTFQRIQRDDRHLELHPLKEGKTDRRLFASWAMRDDPVKTWMWSFDEVKNGLVRKLSPEEALFVFKRLSREIDQFS